MTPELIAILSVGATVLGVGVGLLAVLLTTTHRINQRIDRMENRMDARFDSAEARTDARFNSMDARFDSAEAHTDARFNSAETRTGSRFDGLDTRTQNVEQRLARLEGVLDGLREALFHRPANQG
jgi:hypothetical protein